MMTSIFSKYSDFLVDNDVSVLIISLSIIIVFSISALGVEITAPEYDDMVPDGIESIEAMEFIEDEFGASGETANILIEVDPRNVNSTEPRDIRDPEVLRYMNTIQQKLSKIGHVESYQSAAERILDTNERIPQTRTKVIEVMQETEEDPEQEPVETIDVLSHSVSNLREIEKSLMDQIEAIREIEEGLNDTTDGLERIKSNIDEVADSTSKMTVEDAGSDELIEVIRNTQQNASSLLNTLNTMEQNLIHTNDSLFSLRPHLEETPEAEEIFNDTAENLEDIAFNLEQASTHAFIINQSLSGIEDGVLELLDGIDEMSDGAQQIEDSLLRIVDSIDQTIMSMEDMVSGLDEIADSSEQFSGAIGNISHTLDEAKNYMEIFEADGTLDELPSFNPYYNLVSDDYLMGVIRLSLADMSQEQMEEFAKEVESVLEESEKPSGISVSPSGFGFTYVQMLDETDRTMTRTTILSATLLLTLLITFFLSIRYGFTVFLTIVFGEIIALGSVSLLGIPISSEMAGALSMIMAIGDDFGIQVTNRFKQELRDKNAKEAMNKTLSNVILPMSITTIGLLIGFRAFTFGRIELLENLGIMLSIGVLACYISAITVIPAILTISERKLSDKDEN